MGGFRKYGLTSMPGSQECNGLYWLKTFKSGPHNIQFSTTYLCLVNGRGRFPKPTISSWDMAEEEVSGELVDETLTSAILREPAARVN